MKARKLIAEKQLKDIYARYSVGVPLRRAMRDFNIKLSEPTFANIISVYDDLLKYEQNKNASSVEQTLRNSLFPAWVVKEVPGAQEQPANWKYIGTFPVGSWQEYPSE